MNKSLVVLAVVATAGIGTALVFEKQKSANLEATIKSLRDDSAQLNARAVKDQAEIQRLRDQMNAFLADAKASRKRTSTSEDSETTGSENVTASGKSSKERSGGDGFMKGLAKMFTDPEMKKSMKVQQSLGIRMMYGELFKQLKLSPEETEQLSDILTERQMEMGAKAMTAMDKGGKTDAREGGNSNGEKGQYEEQLKATLGDANYSKLKEYEKSMGDRFMMHQFEGQFAVAGAPLTAGQRESLLGIMQEERSRAPAHIFDPANRNNPKAQIEALRNDKAVDEFVANQETINRNVLERARQMLTPDQMAALEKVQQQMLEMIRAQVKMQRQMLGGEK